MQIPLSVVLYVVVGGMRATLLADYTHTTALFIMCVRDDDSSC